MLDSIEYNTPTTDLALDLQREQGKVAALQRLVARLREQRNALREQVTELSALVPPSPDGLRWMFTALFTDARAMAELPVVVRTLETAGVKIVIRPARSATLADERAGREDDPTGPMVGLSVWRVVDAGGR
jgi:hypothetical protein